MSSRFPLAFALCALLAVSSIEAAPPTVTVDDIVALLKAEVGEKVILRQVAAAPTRLTLTVEALLRLKAAGAGDDLLEALQGFDRPSEEDHGAGPSPSGRAADGRAESSIRVYTRLNEQGRPVVHLTNLDESGRRIGGEVEHPAQVNLVQPSQNTPARAPEPVYEPEPFDSGYRDEESRGSVVVNVYSPESGGYGAESPGGFYPGGFFPGYAVGYSPAYHRHSSRCGHYDGGYVISPPGSYSHFLQYHHGPATNPEPHLLGRPRVITVAPYTHGTAAQRNRVQIRRP